MVTARRWDWRKEGRREGGKEDKREKVTPLHTCIRIYTPQRGREGGREGGKEGRTYRW